MLDYNTKFDRRESTSALDEKEIRIAAKERKDRKERGIAAKRHKKRKKVKRIKSRDIAIIG
jgi:hypothetical protein